jgi:hypothetical protein
VKYERQGLYLNLSSFDGMVFTFKKVDWLCFFNYLIIKLKFC